MGWWQAEKDVLVGDEPLDAVEECLDRVAQEYQREHGRKPTLKEILRCLTLVLRNRADELLDEPPGTVVAEINARTKRAKRREIYPGDVFSVQLRPGEYAFGRLTPQIGLVEFFEIKSPKLIRASRLRNLKTFRFPALVMLDPLKEGRWRIFDHLPYEDSGFQIQPFRIAGQIECGNKIVDGFIDPSSQLRAAKASELEGVPEHRLWNAELVEKKLRERLAGVDSPPS